MKKIGYLAALAMVLMASSAMAITPNPNGVYAPDPLFTRWWNDYPQSTNTVTNSYPALVSWDTVVPFALTGWANKGVWELSADGGASKLEFPNWSNYSYEADFAITGVNVAHAEGGIEASPWWTDDGGYFMANIGGEITFWNGKLPYYGFTANFGVTYALGQTIHEKIRYISGPTEPTIATPPTAQYSIIYAGLPYVSPLLPCDPANPADPPPHNVGIGQLDGTKLGGQMMGGPIMGDANNGAGEVKGTWTNINFQNLDAEATPTHTSTWGSVKALYR